MEKAEKPNLSQELVQWGRVWAGNKSETREYAETGTWAESEVKTEEK